MEDNIEFKYRVAQVLSNEFRQDDIVPVCATPKLVRSVGFSDCEIVITQKHIRNCLALEDPRSREHRHDLPIDFMDNLPRYIQTPAMILQSMTQPDSIVLVTDCKDKRDRPIVVALKNAGKGTVGGKVIDCNVVTSTYGRNGFTEFLNNSLKNNCLLYCDIKKSRDSVVSAGLRLPGLLANLDSMTIIRRYNENVNTFKQKILRNPKNYMPENYGQTLYRPDGLPFAYVDPDGRQRLIEYGTKEDGTAYVVKTSVTLSDRRTEKTEYDKYSTVTALERVSADGRETYTYSSDGFMRSSEKSVVSGVESEYSQSKSIHEKTREKREERGYYYGHTQDSWEELDEHGRTTSVKYCTYGDNENRAHAYGIKYEYDRYGNRISEIHDDGSVYKTEYYPPSVVRDMYKSYGWSDRDIYDNGINTSDKVKTETARHADGSMHIKQYTIEGEYTQSDYSPDRTLTKFRNESGETFRGKAAELALLKSQGQAPTKAEAKASTSRLKTAAKPAAPGKAVKKDKQTFCKGCNAKGGRDGGAGR